MYTLMEAKVIKRLAQRKRAVDSLRLAARGS